MSSTRSSLLVSAGAVALALAACATPEPRPAPPVVMPPPVMQIPPPVEPPVAPPVKAEPAPLMTPSTFGALPGWERDDLRQAWPAFMTSCGVLGRKPEWKTACGAARTVDAKDGAAIRGYFETHFVPNQVRAADGADTGLITGYYEPLLRGARKRGGAFQTPLYRVPDDLLTIDLASVYPELKNKRVRGRLVGKKVVPYGSRAEIERADVSGKELLWVDDPVEAFFLEVQGSGRVKLADSGETVRVAYADQNGHPYKAIGRWLIEQGELTSLEATAQGIKAWIAAHPERRQELFNANPSFIFFREERLPDPSVGPKGALGVALTPARSVAIDPTLLPLGAPIYLATTESGSDVPMQRLVMGQDTGGAIRGAVRADFFFGFGYEAMENAGRMKQRGQLWVLLPKP
ncbi:murein transglycosylase A [Massilia pseudoviolaceinigra]|uniref:murein transglycosylase A n=1 Tax=Massilia pseudoviolaceinigra TaxID=3057165 RepID=UPI00279681FF|nr:murein transglycosylase A [Massilia sp. CCM 9206]MDQ1924378.1 murein transglycosylase A [Massilia sp. CCM 9206]